MGITNFDIIQANQYLGLPASSGGGGATDESNTGAVFYVNNSTTGLLTGAIQGSNGNSGTSPLEPFATIDYAIGRCTANRGDTIYVMPGHSETLQAASAITCDVDGIEIVGIGTGSSRPQLIFGTSTAASVVISADAVKIKNILARSNIDGLINPFNVTGDHCHLDIECHDDSDTIEAARWVLLTSTLGARLKLTVRGRTAGNAMVNAVRLNGCFDTDIEIDGYGVVSTAWIEFVTVASTDTRIVGTLYTQGITNHSRDVVDTIGGSTWSARIFDVSEGAFVSGGSAAALATDDVSTIDSKIGTITNTGGTATIGAILGDFSNTTLISKLNVPTADAAANVDVGDVVGNKTDAGVQAVSATASLVGYSKGILDQLSGTTGIATYPAAAAPANGVSISEVLRDIWDALRNGTGGSEPGANTSLHDVLAGSGGIVSYPASAIPANGVSMAAVEREIYDQAEKAVTNTTSILSNNQTLFTITGGPIEILSLVLRCVTGNDATATTVQFRSNPTVGAAGTFSAASASLANALAGASVVLQGTTLATAPTLNASGPGLGQQVTNAIYCPEGTIQLAVAVGSTTGTWQAHMRYRPLSRGVTVA